MCPASLFAPQAPEFITDSIISSSGQTAVLAFAEFVVALGNLPDCRALLTVEDENSRGDEAK